MMQQSCGFIRSLFFRYRDNLEETLRAESSTVVELDGFPAKTAPLTLYPEKKVTRESGFAFEVQESLGEGGMGTVYLARQDQLMRDVAIKRLHSSQQQAAVQAALVGEATLLARLDHPHIPPIHMFGYDDDGLPLLVMKRIEGISWKALVSDQEHPFWDNLPRDRFAWHLRAFLQLCHAVEYAHSKRVLHRDIKTENVMIGAHGELYLIDWGVAKEFNSPAGVEASRFAGTPRYAAPEMFSGDRVLSPATDVYLLGATLTEVLLGRAKHGGSNLQEVISEALISEPTEFPPEIHPELAAICNCATHKESEYRYQDVRSLIDAIEEHLENRDALDSLQSAEEVRERLVAEFEKAQFNERIVMRLAFESRFAFEEVLRKKPNTAEAKKGLLDTMGVMVRFEAAKKNTVHAHGYLEEMRGLGAGRLVLEELEATIDRAQSKKQQAEELATQIQYKLMEQVLKKS